MIYVTPSGRRWRASPCRYHGGEKCTLMTPIGATGFGGVKQRHVDNDRLRQGDKTWKPE